MKISEYIHNHLSLKRDSSDVSTMADLDEFFAGIPEKNAETWHLAFPSDKIKTLYSTAKVVQDRFGFNSSLDMVVHFKFPGAELTLNEKLEYDDNLRIEIVSLMRKSGAHCGTFIFELIKKHRQFMRQFDAIQAQKGLKTSSQIDLNAFSGKCDNIPACGGFFWAVQGFDFAAKSELLLARSQFQNFAQRNGVMIDKRDLKFFTKPCHFAAFQCGVKVDGKNIGKAFLLNHSWYGQMRLSAKGTETEEYRYARAYNQHRENNNYQQAAALELNKPFLRMMKKYHKMYAPQPTIRQGLINRLRQKLLLSFGIARSL